eukprot:TRINITY_DN3651_c0_g1_i1.p1 TRINITY_DN3651_c0_g1~~TRINITY_DN3651_c0_g1_i1.p1  ORF type:complete len:131 (-),score=4.32 TRINITY_DN3651_c0_g1_i1:137-529(-)
MVLCVILASLISFKTGKAESIFGSIFMIVWAGSVIVTMNTRFLGGPASLFQSICVMGYCIFPLIIPVVVSFFFNMGAGYKTIVIGTCLFWSIISAMAFMGDIVPEHRRFLGTYPIVLFYVFISCFVFMAT